MSEYRLLAHLWTGKDGVRRRRGDVFTPPDSEVQRLLKAGAIVSADPNVAVSEPVSDGKPGRPRQTAPVAEWRKYAVESGKFNADEAEELTKAELIEILS
ncbi:hypothetical protein A5788_22340 [Gordonia sp. 852002-50816_SCH5313054-c]|nr:hypothetical protein A5788_22340 [Gordonia sp. 852002-50816_SCH5313054-c]OBC17604.1 hypothetical protein A5786_18960 [Gordonia sp. 852002-50816_SCH5313054-a]